MTDAIKERPILFSGPMVRAIREGRKTMTRRLVRLQPGNAFPPFRELPTCQCHPFGFRDGIRHWKSPYGRPGDRLWVREGLHGEYTTVDADTPNGRLAAYSADGEPAHRDDRPASYDWKPSKLSARYMPRWASRILLEITGVRVERLWEISESDAIAEGFDVGTCADAFRRAAGKTEQKYGRWLELEDRSNPDGYWCVDCVDAAAKRMDAEIDGWNDYFESDCPEYCNECGVSLRVSLTTYGVDTVLGLTDDDHDAWAHLPAHGNQALSLFELSDGMGDLREEHHGRLAQVGFATCWESINGPDSWEANPWVWVVGFRVLEGLA